MQKKKAKAPEKIGLACGSSLASRSMRYLCHAFEMSCFCSELSTGTLGTNTCLLIKSELEVCPGVILGYVSGAPTRWARREKQAKRASSPSKPSLSTSLPSSPRAKPPDLSKWLTGKLESIPRHGQGAKGLGTACADAALPGGASSSACSSSPPCAWAPGSCLPRAKTKCEYYLCLLRLNLPAPGNVMVVFCADWYLASRLWRSSLILAFVCCYLMWALTFLAQLHPLIEPKRSDLREKFVHE